MSEDKNVNKKDNNKVEKPPLPKIDITSKVNEIFTLKTIKKTEDK